MPVEVIKVEYSRSGSTDVDLGDYVLSVRGRGYSPSDELEDVLFLTQVHGSSIIANPRPGTRADGAVIPAGGMLPGIRTADCLPVFLGSKSHLAAAHAGWRGLSVGILTELLIRFPVEPEIVILGNCICGKCYEVGPDVLNALEEWIDSGKRSTGTVDLRQVALSQLSSAGLSDSVRVCILPECTLCGGNLFHSFRADATGRRNLSWLRRK